MIESTYLDEAPFFNYNKLDAQKLDKFEDTGKGKGREEERTSFLFPSPMIIVECVVESARRCNGREKKNKN